MTNYAGFWKRLLAAIIDGILIGIVQWVILVPILAAMGIGAASNMENMGDDPAAMMGAITAIFGAVNVIVTVVWVLYHTLMESSKMQATVGKMALSIKVTDVNGAKLDFVKALIRNLSKIVSTMILFIGYIMAAFTEKKQGLHDIIAGTLVVNK
ncbi:MAG: RDD family protein [Cyclobacteriaceae bacterium]|jgi:uncharacterized RDD family membrane protein YckC